MGPKFQGGLTGGAPADDVLAGVSGVSTAGDIGFPATSEFCWFDDDGPELVGAGGVE